MRSLVIDAITYLSERRKRMISNLTPADIVIVDHTINPPKAELSLRGLSSDEKPTGTFRGYTIGNGSSFFEIDTQSIKFYNETASTWI